MRMCKFHPNEYLDEYLDEKLKGYCKICDVFWGPHNQLERSKREESHKLVYREPNPEMMSDAMKAKYEKAKAICGALNIVETQ